MANRKISPPAKSAVAAPAGDFFPYRLLLWLVLFANSLFLLPWCLDRYLAPRFLFLSAVLLAGLWWLRRDLGARADWRLQGFDLLLLAWYGLNAASVGWAFSWSEGVFFAQKTLLLFLSYWLLRQALHVDEAATRRTMAQATMGLTFIAGSLVAAPLAYAALRFGLDNEVLYDYASGVSGNKGLASDFLFFLLVFNVLFYREIARKAWFWAGVALLFLLIFLLQTRTVYLALAGAMLVYFPLRAMTERAFRPVFLKIILPAGLFGVCLLAGFLAFKGGGSSLAERLNPATYLESASANERRFVWYKTDLLNQEHYWWGVGNGAWKIWFPSKSIRGAYRLEEKSVVFTRAHNDYLEVRAEMGMIGFLLFSALFVVAFGVGGRKIFALARRNSSPEGEGSAPSAGGEGGLPALLAGLLGYCVIQYFDFPRERIEMQVVLAIFFAFIAHYARSVWAGLPGIFMGKYKSIFFSLAFIGLIFNVLIGWQRVWGEVHNVRLMLAMNRGDYPAVLREAQAARNTFYEYNDVVLPLQWYDGIAHLQMRRSDLAAADLEIAARLNPWSFQVLNNYASALAMNRRYPEAISVYEQTLAINPRYEEGQINLALALIETGELARATDLINGLDTIPNPKTDDDRAKNRLIQTQKAKLFDRLRQRSAGQ